MFALDKGFDLPIRMENFFALAKNKSYAVLRGALLLATHRFSFSSFFAGHRLSNRSAEMKPASDSYPSLSNGPVYPPHQFIQKPKNYETP